MSARAEVRQTPPARAEVRRGDFYVAVVVVCSVRSRVPSRMCFFATQLLRCRECVHARGLPSTRCLRALWLCAREYACIRRESGRVRVGRSCSAPSRAPEQRYQAGGSPPPRALLESLRSVNYARIVLHASSVRSLESSSGGRATNNCKRMHRTFLASFPFLFLFCSPLLPSVAF